MKKQPLITAQTKANIVEAYWKCAEKEPSGKITVKDIIEIAGYNRSTFYQYFADITSLSDYAENDIIEKLEAIILDTLSSELSPSVLELALRRFFNEYGRYLKIMLTGKSSLSFIYKFKEVLKPLVLIWSGINHDTLDVSLICNFVGSNIISALEYLCLHEDADQKQIVYKLHSYLHEGVPGLLKCQ